MTYKYRLRARARRRKDRSRFAKACRILALPPGIYPKSLTIMMAGL